MEEMNIGKKLTDLFRSTINRFRPNKPRKGVITAQRVIQNEKGYIQYNPRVKCFGTFTPIKRF